jgi:hypothetical protein
LVWVRVLREWEEMRRGGEAVEAEEREGEPKRWRSRKVRSPAPRSRKCDRWDMVARRGGGEREREAEGKGGTAFFKKILRKAGELS